MKKMYGRKMFYLKADWDAARVIAANSEYDIKKLKQEYQTLKDRLDKFLESSSEIVKKAIKAVISFAKSKIYF